LKKDEVLSREELEHVIKSSEDKGLLTPDETLLVSGFLDLQDTEVKELMWPKNDILYYDINMPLTKLTHLFLEKEVSRLPVIDNNLDNLLGVIDAYTYFIKMPEIKEPRDLIKYLKKPFFVPETIPAKTLLKRIDAEDQEIAIVVDEYGSVTGLIAREDLLEVVVGQIEDQRDQLLLYTKASKNEIIASGKMELLEFNDLFDVELISENNLMTLGGWLTEQAGDIPQSGSKYSFNGFTFQILSSTPTHVERVYVRKEEDG
jgi:CBS domain containing-hemolysin-like protein